MSKHTPGPWTVSELDARGEPSEFYIFIEPGVAVIERAVAGQDASDRPNAHLMAAAPDLLEALIHLEEAARALQAAEIDRNSIDVERRIARAAIATATQEASHE